MLRFSRLMTEFLHGVGLGEPDVDENNHYFFHVDNMTVSCFEINSSVYLQATLGSLPSQEEQQINQLKRALKLGLANAMQYKVSLTIDEQNQLILFDRYPGLVVNLEQFEIWFGDFLDCLEIFKKHLDESANPIVPTHSFSEEQIFIG